MRTRPIVQPEERLRVFGQHDHVRRYGRDFVERLREVGFQITVNSVPEMFSREDQKRMGIGPGSEIYFCRK